MAGLIFSSFPPERIRRSPHRRINIIERTPDIRTNNDIAKRINSQKSICCPSIEFDASKAYAFSKNIREDKLIKYF
jgi:hypothetical protein